MDLDNLIKASVNFEQVIKSCIEGLINHQSKVDTKLANIDKILSSHSLLLAGFTSNRTLEDIISSSSDSNSYEENNTEINECNNYDKLDNSDISIFNNIDKVIKNIDADSCLITSCKNVGNHSINNNNNKSYIFQKTSNKNAINQLDIINKSIMKKHLNKLNKTISYNKVYNNKITKEVKLKLNNNNNKSKKSSIINKIENNAKINKNYNIKNKQKKIRNKTKKQILQNNNNNDIINNIDVVKSNILFNNMQSQSTNPANFKRSSIFSEDKVKYTYLSKIIKEIKQVINDQSSQIHNLDVKINKEEKNINELKEKESKVFLKYEERINELHYNINEIKKKLLSFNYENEINVLLQKLKTLESKTKAEFNALPGQIILQLSQTLVPDVKRTVFDDVISFVDNSLLKSDYRIKNIEANFEVMNKELNNMKNPVNLNKLIVKCNDFINLKDNANNIKTNYDIIVSNNDNNCYNESSLKYNGNCNNSNSNNNNNNNSTLSPSVVNYNLKKEIEKTTNTLLKKINESEIRLNSFINCSNIDNINKELNTLKYKLNEYPSVEYLNEALKNTNINIKETNYIKEELANYITNNNSSDIIEKLKKKIEANYASIQKQLSDDKEEILNNKVDLSNYIDIDTFDNYKQNNTHELSKIFNKYIDVKNVVDHINRKHNELNKELEELNCKITNNVEDVGSITNNIKLNYLNKRDFSNKIKLVDNQIKYLVEAYMKYLEKGETWILAKNKLHTMNCASCEKAINNNELTKNKEENQIIKANKNGDNYNNLGNGFSKKLKSIDINKINNYSKIKQLHNSGIYLSNRQIKKMLDNNNLTNRSKNMNYTFNKDNKDEILSEESLEKENVKSNNSNTTNQIMKNDNNINLM